MRGKNRHRQQRRREHTGAPGSPQRTWAEKDGRSPTIAFAVSTRRFTSVVPDRSCRKTLIARRLSETMAFILAALDQAGFRIDRDTLPIAPITILGLDGVAHTRERLQSL